ncbi:prepilin-type N-terminal cleavage/methylation domain-containing protein [Candidatus Dojkabacteria bacterium]|nr:prepilin-type N-terminal cleavage/methylation domain-containing protein [Candidatus Dojkabacteria bacterium]
MKKKSYQGFTLIEMVVVVIIIIILSAAGVIGTRSLIANANKAVHKNAVKNLYQAATAYYGEKGEFPAQAKVGTLLNQPVSGGGIKDFAEGFDGGADTDYLYAVSPDQQHVLICASLGGYDDAQEKGYVCDGNGLANADVAGGAVTTTITKPGDPGYSAFNSSNFAIDQWSKENSGWGVSGSGLDVTLGGDIPDESL